MLSMTTLPTTFGSRNDLTRLSRSPNSKQACPRIRLISCLVALMILKGCRSRDLGDEEFWLAFRGSHDSLALIRSPVTREREVGDRNSEHHCGVGQSAKGMIKISWGKPTIVKIRRNGEICRIIFASTSRRLLCLRELFLLRRVRRGSRPSGQNRVDDEPPGVRRSGPRYRRREISSVSAPKMPSTESNFATASSTASRSAGSDLRSPYAVFISRTRSWTAARAAAVLKIVVHRRFEIGRALFTDSARLRIRPSLEYVLR